jgi:serine/threonine protein kinase
VYDVAEADGLVFFTMAYIEGESLAARARRAPLSIAEAASVVRTLALAMQEAHMQGVIHRDLKPANVLIDREGQPIVTDFGLARPMLAAEATALTQDGQMLGTPAYMPPEQVVGEAQGIGPWSDQYSLGMILYELSVSPSTVPSAWSSRLRCIRCRRRFRRFAAICLLSWTPSAGAPWRKIPRADLVQWLSSPTRSCRSPRQPQFRRQARRWTRRSSQLTETRARRP